MDYFVKNPNFATYSDDQMPLKHVAEIIKIDGKVTDKEREFLFTIAEKLKLSKSDAEALL